MHKRPGGRECKHTHNNIHDVMATKTSNLQEHVIKRDRSTVGRCVYDVLVILK
jgi:hypothetical protein